MPFIEPKDPQDPNSAKHLEWLVRGTMKATFFFHDATLASTVSYGIFPSGFSSLMLKGLIGDGNFDDDIIGLDVFEEPLRQVSPSKRSLSVFLIPRERGGQQFDFTLSFFSDQTGFSNQDYKFLGDENPIGVRVPIKFVND